MPDMDAMHDVTDVVMASLHSSFDGRTLDAATVAFALSACGMGVLRDCGFDHVNERASEFAKEVDVDHDINRFDPSQH
jgi:hypothetical protein